MKRNIILFTVAASMVCNLAVRAGDATAIPDAYIGRAAEAPKIDGSLEDPAWLESARSHRGVLSGWTIWPRVNKLADQQRIAYVVYDDKNLYIAMQAYVSDILDLETHASGNPFLGDCLEIFVKAKDGKLLHIGVDSSGHPFEGGDILAGMNVESTDISSVEAKSGLGKNYWVAEVAIPWKVIGVEPKKGLVLNFNLSANKAQQAGIPATITWGREFGNRPVMPMVELQ